MMAAEGDVMTVMNSSVIYPLSRHKPQFNALQIQI